MTLKNKIKIDIKLYKKDIIYKVIDFFSNEYYIQIEKKDNLFYLSFTPKYKDKIELDKLKMILFEHLNHQLIREKIAKEKNKIMQLIVSKALFETEAFDDNSKFFNNLVRLPPTLPMVIPPRGPLSKLIM